MVENFENYCVELNMTIDGVDVRTHYDESLDDALAGASVAIAISSASLVQVAGGALHYRPFGERERERAWQRVRLSLSLSLFLPLLSFSHGLDLFLLSLCFLHSSAACCAFSHQAVFMGIPTISLDYVAPVYRISCHSFDNLRSVVFEGTDCRPPRAQWLYDLAYTMWNTDDVRNGNLFRYLFRAGEQHWGTFDDRPFRFEDSEYIS